MKLTDRRALGRGLQVSPICLGMVETPDVVLTAFDAGINFFFVTADMHWPLYAPLREGLRRLLKRPAVRNEVVVCGTAYVTQPEFCEAPFEELIAEVPGLGHLDVLVAGGAYRRDFKHRQPIYAEHRRSGFVGCRAVGASFHERKAAKTALVGGEIDLGFVRFSPSHPGAKRDVLPFVRRSRALTYGFKSVHGWLPGETLLELGLEPGAWQPHPTDHYRYALSHEGIDGVLIALSHRREVKELADALARGPLSADEVRYLERLAAAVAR